jgi:transposase-like protein
MVKILREADATPMTEVAKKHHVSEQTLYVWRKRFGTMGPQETKRLKRLDRLLGVGPPRGGTPSIPQSLLRSEHG